MKLSTYLLRARTGLYVPNHSVVPPPGTWQACELVVTAKTGTNGKVLRVKCKCMAQVQIPSLLTPYDWIEEVGTLAAAVRVWKAHVLNKAVNQWWEANGERTPES